MTVVIFENEPIRAAYEPGSQWGVMGSWRSISAWRV